VKKIARLRIQFIHGLEGSPQGAKARLLSRHFDTLTPAMDTSDFEACVALQADALANFRPDVLVGSSFGGAVAVALLQRGLWRGATLLLAQAALRRGARAGLPGGVPIWLVHGLRDELIDIEDSRRLAAAGAPEWVVLHEVDDDHPLHETVASGRLVELVRELAASASTRR
jgi:predicted esterase